MTKKFIGSAALTASSDTGFDLDTKGQLHGYTTIQYALDVGTNNYIIYADSTTSSGLVYGASAKSILSGTGDILYSSGANTLARLAIGSTDDVLTIAGGVPTWASAGGGGLDPVFYSSCGINRSGGALLTYLPLGGSHDNAEVSETYTDQVQDSAVKIVRIHVVAIAVPNVDSAVSLRDDGATPAGLGITLTASTSGDYDSGVIAVTIVAGSLVDWELDANGTGSYNVVSRALEGT